MCQLRGNNVLICPNAAWAVNPGPPRHFCKIWRSGRFEEPLLPQTHLSTTMWTASPAAAQRPWPSVALPISTNVKAPLQRTRLEFKLRRKWRAQDQERPRDPGDDEDTQPAPLPNEKKTSGIVGKAVRAAVKFIPPTQQQPLSQSQSSSAGVRAPQSQRKAGAPAPPPQPRKLSGSDILKALQRASVEKAKQQSLKQKKSRKSNNTGSSIADRLDDHTVSDTTKRPLCIKSEWGVRLEELEKRLQDIMLLDQQQE